MPLNLKKTINFLFILLLLLGGRSAYAECKVGSTYYDVGGREGSGVVTNNRSNPITSLIIKNAQFLEDDNTTNDVSTCDVSSISTFNQNFYGETFFNQDIGSWDMSNAGYVYRMFKGATAFNQDIGSWDVSNAYHMSYMFDGATAFNQDLSGWDVSKVNDMDFMFNSATNFNQDLSGWDVSKVTKMKQMFADTSFDQDIGSWNVSNVAKMSLMFHNVTLSTANYDALLIGWNKRSLTTGTGVAFSGGNSKSTDASVASRAKANIISTYGWTFTDGGTVVDSTFPTLISFTPTDGTTGVALDTNITLTFSEIIYINSGNIIIKKSSDGSAVETIAVGDTKITGTGTKTITLNPSSTLVGSTDYYLAITSTAFEDTASNDYAGISNTTTLNFTTVTTNLPSPLDKKDVIGSIKVWSSVSSKWADSSIESVSNRMNWLSRHKDTTQTSHQGVKITFENKVVDAVMNASVNPSLFTGVNFADKASALLQNTDGSLVAVGEHIQSDVANASINEAARIRHNAIGSLNPSFGTVMNDWSVWTEGSITIGKTDANLTASKLESDSKAITLGFDKPLGTDGLMGFALSVGQDDTDVGTDATNVKSDNYSLSSYNVFNPANSNFQVESVIGLSRLDFDTVRTDGSDTLTGARKANQAFLSTTLRPVDNINHDDWVISPYGKLTLAHTRLDSFSETGAATALTYNKQTVRDSSVGFGIDINTQMVIDNSTIKPFAKLELNQSSSDSSASMNYSNEDPSDYAYTTNLDKTNRNWKAKIGTELVTKSGWDMSVAYTREQSFGSSDDTGSSNGLSLDAGIKF